MNNNKNKPLLASLSPHLPVRSGNLASREWKINGARFLTKEVESRGIKLQFAKDVFNTY